MLYRVWWLTLGPLIRVYWRLRVHDRHKTLGLGGLIIASNHQSGIDPVLICMSYWRHVYWLAKIELVMTKKIAWFFKSVSVIPVDRGAPRDESLIVAAEVVKRGEIFGVFPEGTRGPDERVYRGHTGVARVAHLSGGAVIPTAVIGSARACPKGKVVIRPVRCDVVYGDPMYFAMRPGESESQAYRRFTDEVMEAIAALAGTTYVSDVYSSDARREHQRLAS